MIFDFIRTSMVRCNDKDEFATRRGIVELKKRCYQSATKRAGSIYKSEEAEAEVVGQIKRERARNGKPELRLR